MSSLILNKGTWDNISILGDSSYFNQMVTPSQDINQAYGYLWWLNGSSSYMLPSSQIVFSGFISPNAPAELYTAIGKNGQYLDIFPSENISVIRLGDAPGDDLVPLTFHNEMWEQLSQIFCITTSTTTRPLLKKTKLYPNPFSEELFIDTEAAIKNIHLYDTLGNLILQQEGKASISGFRLPAGIYFLKITDENNRQVIEKIIKE